MNTIAEEQTPTPKKKNTLQRTLIIMIFVLLVFIIVCISLTAYIIIRQGPAEPKRLVLRHPSNEMVPAGVTREDLKKAMELSKDWASDHIKGALSGAAQGDFSQSSQESLENLYSIDQLLSSGRIARIVNGTRCILTDSGWTLCQVQITEGPFNGQRYWVYRKCLSRVSDKEISEGLFCGFMCASVYLRYFITAVICCVGIYALKLKSMFMQFVLFIAGMVLLNLLWARIAMLLIL